MRIRHLVIGSAALTLGLLAARLDLDAQRGGPPAAPRTARTSAPVDLAGTWVSVVSEDWRWRMVTPLKGDAASVPLNGAGRGAVMAWDLDKDNAAKYDAADVKAIKERIRKAAEKHGVEISSD